MGNETNKAVETMTKVLNEVQDYIHRFKALEEKVEKNERLLWSHLDPRVTDALKEAREENIEMKKDKGFSFNFEKEELRVLDPRQTKALKQLMKTSVMHQVTPEMNYVLPGKTLIKILDQISKLKNELEKYERAAAIAETADDEEQETE